MIAAAITLSRVIWAVAVPLAVYAGQTAVDVWAKKQKRKTGTRKRRRKPARRRR